MFTIYRRWWFIVLRVHSVTECYSRMNTGLNNRVLRDESESRIEIFHTIYLDCVLAFLDFFYLLYDIAIIVRSSLILTELCNFIWDACSNFLRVNYCMLKTDVKLDISSVIMMTYIRMKKTINIHNRSTFCTDIVHNDFINLNLFYY